jgi:hypothetical protein
VPVVEALPVSGDDEEGVVDADAQADHRRQQWGEGHDVHVSGQDHKPRQADAQAEQGGEYREAHREQRAERDQQDQHCNG